LVRVATRPETIQRSKESEFVTYRKKGVPAAQIDPTLVEPMVEMTMLPGIWSLNEYSLCK